MWATLLPDGELSLFEQRLLDAHCARCAECRRMVDSIGGLTALVRTTPPEVMERPVRIVHPRPAYWRTAPRMLATGGAAALALVLAFWVAPAGTHKRRSTSATVPLIVVTSTAPSSDVARIWQLKRARTAIGSGAQDGHHTGVTLA